MVKIFSTIGIQGLGQARTLARRYCKNRHFFFPRHIKPHCTESPVHENRFLPLPCIDQLDSVGMVFRKEHAGSSRLLYTVIFDKCFLLIMSAVCTVFQIQSVSFRLCQTCTEFKKGILHQICRRITVLKIRLIQSPDRFIPGFQCPRQTFHHFTKERDPFRTFSLEFSAFCPPEHIIV